MLQWTMTWRAFHCEMLLGLGYVLHPHAEMQPKPNSVQNASLEDVTYP